MAGKERWGTILSQHHSLAAAGGALKLLDCSERYLKIDASVSCPAACRHG